MLWPEGAPLAQGNPTADIPRLTIYLPKKSFCQTAVIVVIRVAPIPCSLQTTKEGNQPSG